MVTQSLRLVALVVGILLVGGRGDVYECYAQPDSVRAKILKAKGFSPDHSPTGALWRSIAVPGWGQFYNRQYFKIPFVYAGFGAFGFRAYQAHQEYLFYRRAHLYGRGSSLVDEGESNPYQQYQQQFNEAAERLGGERLRAMRQQRDQYRRQRNLSILGMGLFYALTVLDAYVSAHLLTFDVGGDLAIRVRPVGRLGPMLEQSPERTSNPSSIPPEGKALETGVGLRFDVQF